MSGLYEVCCPFCGQLTECEDPSHPDPWEQACPSCWKGRKALQGTCLICGGSAPVGRQTCSQEACKASLEAIGKMALVRLFSTEDQLRAMYDPADRDLAYWGGPGWYFITPDYHWWGPFGTREEAELIRSQEE